MERKLKLFGWHCGQIATIVAAGRQKWHSWYRSYESIQVLHTHCLLIITTLKKYTECTVVFSHNCCMPDVVEIPIMLNQQALYSCDPLPF